MPKTTSKNKSAAKKKPGAKKSAEKKEKKKKTTTKAKTKTKATKSDKKGKRASSAVGAVKKDKKQAPEGKYYEAVGKRKTSAAKVRLWDKGKGEVVVNGKPLEKYFFTMSLKKTAAAALTKLESLNKFNISVVVSGGGVSSQAEAVRHGIARALVKMNPEFRKKLKKWGYLTRDDRRRERKKPGLKRARRAPQWKKR